MKFKEVSCSELAQKINDPSNELKFILTGFYNTNQWEIKERVLDDHLLYFTLNGGWSGKVGGEKVAGNPSSIFWLSPGVQNEFHKSGSRKGLSLYNLRFQIYSRGQALRLDTDFLYLTKAASLQVYFQKINNELRNPDEWSQQRLRSYLFLLMTEFIKWHHNQADDVGRLNNFQKDACIKFVNSKIDQKVGHYDLAKLLKLSPDYFSRMFKKSFGVSPKTWIMEERLKASLSHLLETQKNISEIADEFGYQDIYLYSRQFKNYFGVSPMAYRKNPFSVNSK